MFSLGSTIAGAFRLVKDRPGSIAAWGLIYLLLGLGSVLAMQPFAGMQAPPADGADLDLAAMSSMFGLFFAFMVVIFTVCVVLYTAALRAVLRPRERGFASLRLGMDELRQLGLALMFAIVFYVGMFVSILIVTVIAALASAVAGGVPSVILMVLGVFGLFAVAAWLFVRLSLCPPLTLLRRRIVIGESWRLTRGRFWSLFGAYLVIFVLLMILWAVSVAVSAGDYLGDLMRGGFNPENMEAAETAQTARQLSLLDPRTAFGWVLHGLIGALGFALTGGAVATATRALAAAPEEELAITFE